MYQEPSSVHIFSTEDLGFLVAHRTVWVPVFQNQKNRRSAHPSEARKCNYAALSVILWNILQESKRFLDEKVGTITPPHDSPPLLSLPQAASPATLLADNGRIEEGGGTPPPPADPHATTVDWLTSWSSSLSSSWFDRDERWRSTSERESFFLCLRRTTYAATLLATVLSMAVGAEVRTMVRVGAEDIRLTIHLLESLNRLFLDLSGFLEAYPSPPPPPLSCPMTADAATPTTTPSFSSLSPSLTVFDGPFAHHPPSRPYDAPTHRLFLAVEESFLQVQLLLVALPRGGATPLDEADVTPIFHMMYRTEMWDASGVSLRTTQGYLAALKALFLSSASSPSLSHTTGLAESEGKMLCERVLQRPPYRHHSFRYSFLRAHREHAGRPQTTTSSSSSGTDPRATTPSTAPSSSSAKLSDNPPSSTSPVPLPIPDFTQPPSSSSPFDTASSPEASDAGLYYPGGRCGGVLEPSFGLLQLFWAVKDGLEAILCPSTTTPVLAMAAIPSQMATSPPPPHVALEEMERNGLRQVGRATQFAFDQEVDHHRREGARLSFYQLLGYAMWNGMPTVEVVPWAPLWERAWHTRLLAASSLPCGPSPPMDDAQRRPTASAAPFSSSETEKGHAAMSSPHSGGEGVPPSLPPLPLPPVWMGNAVLQSYYTPVFRLLLATCYTVKRGEGTTRTAGGGKKGWLSFFSSSSSSSVGQVEEEEDDEEEDDGWHAFVSPDSMVAVWDAIGTCIFQDGAGRSIVGNLPLPALPALPSLPLSLRCCHLYAPFTTQDVQPVVRVCRWLFRHPLLHVLPPLALSTSWASSCLPQADLSDTSSPKEEAEAVRQCDKPPTTPSPLLMTTIPHGKGEEERVSQAFAVVQAMAARVRWSGQVWYHAGEEVQHEIWRTTAPSWRPWEKEKKKEEEKESNLLPSSSASSAPLPTSSSPSVTSSATGSAEGGVAPGEPTSHRPPFSVPPPPRPPHCLTRVALPRLCAWIEMLTAVLTAALTHGMRRAIFPSVLLPSLLDSLTRVFALYTVFVVHGRESLAGVYTRGGGGGSAEEEAEEGVAFPSFPTSRAMALQMAALSSLMCALPARLPSSAVNTLVVTALVPLAQQVAEDGVRYGVGKEGRRRRGVLPRTSTSTDSPSSEERRSGKGGGVQPKDALFYARLEGHLRALGTPVSAFAVSDEVFLTYWTDIALTGCLAIPTPRMAASSFSVSTTTAPGFLQSLWTTAMDFFLAAFYSKRLLCPLLLPSLLRLMIPSTPPTDTSSSASPSLFSFHYPAPPLALLTHFCRRIRTVCESVVECDGVQLEHLLNSTQSIPYQLAKKAYACHTSSSSSAVTTEEGGGGREQVVGRRMWDTTPAWTSPFFFPSTSLFATLPTMAVGEEEGGGGVASPTLFSPPSSVHTEPQAAGGGAGDTTAAVRPSPPAWEEVLCKVTPCSAVLLVVSSLFDQLCVLVNAVVHRGGNASTITQFSNFFSALCTLLMVRHTEVLPRVCASLEALLTEHLRSRPLLMTQCLSFIEVVVANNTGPLKAPLVQWYLHLVHLLGGVKSRSNL